VRDRTVGSVTGRLESVRLFIERHFLRLKNLSLFALNQVLAVTNAVFEDVLKLGEYKLCTDISINFLHNSRLLSYGVAVYLNALGFERFN